MIINEDGLLDELTLLLKDTLTVDDITRFNTIIYETLEITE